jgi:outer membrane protein TolC
MIKYSFLIFLLFPIISFALNIDDAIENTIKNNYYLKSVNNRINQVYHQTKASKANRYPSLVFQGSYTMLDNAKYTNMDMPAPVPDQKIKFINKDYYNVFAGAEYNIYTGGAVTSKIKRKEAELKSERYRLKEEQKK